jgi:hypothetical protein
VHYHYDDTSIIWDTCGVTPTANTLKFYAYSTTNYNLVPLDCSQKTVSAANVILDSWWNTDGNAVKIGRNKFLCALCVENGYTYVTQFKLINLLLHIYTILLRSVQITLIIRRIQWQE